jgi:hypothetical protein
MRKHSTSKPNKRVASSDSEDMSQPAPNKAGIGSSDSEDIGSPAQNTRSQENKKNCAKRSESAKKEAERMYCGKCALTGVKGPGTQLAHIVPWTVADIRQNMIALRSDLHQEYDSFLWVFDPSTKEVSSRRGFSRYGIHLSDKGECEHTAIKEFESSTFDIRTDSHGFLEGAWKRYIETNYPDEIGDGTVDRPTKP